MKVLFKEIEINDNDEIYAEKTKTGPRFNWKGKENEYYSIIIYDTDAKIIHYLRVNILGGKENGGVELVKYLPMNPPGDEKHNYYIALMSQSEELDVTDFNIDRKTEINELMEDFGLQVIEKINYISYHENNIKDDRKDDRKDNYFKHDSDLTEDEKKYCRCTLHMAAKNSEKCNKTINRGKREYGCYNPYAVCAKSVGTTTKNCGKNYNFEGIPDDELEAYIELRKLKINGKHTREKMIRAIEKWKSEGN